MCANLIEEESSACGSCEACGNEFGPIRQDGIAVGAREEARPANVIQEDASHFLIYNTITRNRGQEKIYRK